VTEFSKARLAAARLSTRLFFLLAGLANAAWAPMVPFAKARTGLGTASFGAVLIALGVGAAAVMPLISFCLRRYGSRRVIAAGALLITAVMPLLGTVASPVALAGALILFGFGIGGLDAAMNAQAVEVERLSGRPLMSGFHGMFSVGGLTGSFGVTLLLGVGLPVASAALLTAAIVFLVWLWQGRKLLPGLELMHRQEGGAKPRRRRLRPAVLLIGALCSVGFLAEGAALDWSALFLHGKGLATAYGGLGYAAFSVTMACGRLTGDRMARRFGVVPLLRASGLVAALGWTAAVLLPGIWSLAGFALIGIGASNIVPLLFSAAARVPGVPASVSIPLITAIGYAGLLTGPGIIGFVAAATSLSVALALVGLLQFSVVGGARLAAGRRANGGA
jgi:fucose permease